MERRLRRELPDSLIKKFLIYPYGETDLIVVSGSDIYNYEVKRTDHSLAREKACKQLVRAKDYWTNHGQNRVWSFYVHGNKEDLLHSYDVELVTSFDPFRTTRYKHYKV